MTAIIYVVSKWQGGEVIIGGITVFQDFAQTFVFVAIEIKGLYGNYHDLVLAIFFV